MQIVSSKWSFFKFCCEFSGQVFETHFWIASKFDMKFFSDGSSWVISKFQIPIKWRVSKWPPLAIEKAQRWAVEGKWEKEKEKKKKKAEKKKEKKEREKNIIKNY